MSDYMIEIVPIAITQVDWNTFAYFAKQTTGRSVTRGLDQNNTSIGTAAAFLGMLKEFEVEGSKPNLNEELGSLLRHVSASFLVFGAVDDDFMIDLLYNCRLAITPSGKSFVLSGNLEEWRTAVINNLTARSTHLVRLVYDKVLLHFESVGLGGLWYSYRKVKHDDQTFKMVEHK